jgi:hypothetical protein
MFGTWRLRGKKVPGAATAYLEGCGVMSKMTAASQAHPAAAVTPGCVTASCRWALRQGVALHSLPLAAGEGADGLQNGAPRASSSRNQI